MSLFRKHTTVELAKTGRMEDPLRVQGITLGKRWHTWLARREKENSPK